MADFDDDLTEDERNILFIKDLNRWPRWPYLPIKRSVSSGWPELAFLYADNNTLVQRANNPFWPGSEGESTTYESVEALVADGWKVD